MGVRYIGSKARVARAIVDLAGSPAGGGRFLDGFCGTGSVAEAAARAGWPVVLNDSLPSAVVMATGRLLRADDVPFDGLGGYVEACRQLESLKGEPGFIHAEYSPASASSAGVERRYFTSDNAARLDVMRSQIANWRTAGAITESEQTLLLADLMQSANSVANISGTYGCFLANWSSQALRPIRLTPRELLPGKSSIEQSVGDVFDVISTDQDVAYFDPPYTKRQYAAYYHLLETLVAGDSPAVGGVTGLRPWQDRASDFCYKTRALDALTRLVMQTTARTVLLSYSDEGHVSREKLEAGLSEAGHVTVHEIETIGRYRPNSAASAARSVVQEFVIEVTPVRVLTDDPSEFEPEGASC